MANTLMHTIEAKRSKRVGAFLLDILFLSIALALISIIGQNTWVPSIPQVKEAEQKLYQYHRETGLYQEEVEGVLMRHTKDKYQDYEDVFFNYFTNYLVDSAPSQQQEIVINGSKEYWFNVHIYGLEDQLNLYQGDDIHPSLARQGRLLFVYKINDHDENIYDELAIPAVMENNLDYLLSAEEQKPLLAFFNSQKEKDFSVYDYALNDLESRAWIRQEINIWRLYAYYVPNMVSLYVLAIISFLILPLILKNGQTLGKKINNIQLYSLNNRTVKNIQVLLYYGMPILISIPLTFTQNVFIFVGGIIVIILLSFLTINFKAKKTSLLNLISQTILINSEYCE